MLTVKTIIKSTTLICLLLVFGGETIAQSKIDSLQNILLNKDENKKSKIFEELANEYFNAGKRELSIAYYLKSAQYSLKYIDTSYLYAINGYGNAGYIYGEIGQYDKAINYSKLSLKYALMSLDTAEITAAYANTGVYYYRLGDFENAINLIKKSLNLNLKAGYEEYLIDDYNALGKFYQSWKKVDIALEYSKKALFYAKKLNIENKIAVCTNSIGLIYQDKEMYDSTIIYLNRALEIDKKLNNQYKIAVRLSNLAGVYAKINTPSKAEKNYIEAIDIFHKLKNNFSLCITKSQFAEFLFYQNRLSESEIYSLQSLEISEKINYKEIIKDNFKRLSKISKANGNYKKAFEYFTKYSSVKDSIFDEKSMETINRLEVKYETEKIESENLKLKNEAKINDLLLQRRKTLLVASALIVVLLFTVAIVLLRMYKSKIKANKALSEKNEELKILNATKDKFFSIISHDLKNPLSAFKNITALLNDNIGNISKDEIQYFISSLKDSSSNTYQLLENLLQWSISQSGNIKYQPKAIELSSAIDKTTQLFELNAKEKEVELKANVANDVKVIADEKMLNTILRNLVSNAIKFTPEKGKVSIESENKNGNIIISINDTGIGISEKDIRKLFRISEDTKTIGSSKEKGTGLGLILCKEMVERCGGKIFAKSQLNQGSSFNFTLLKA